MMNLIKRLQDLNTYMYLVILLISLVHIQSKYNKITLNIFFDLMIIGLNYIITKNFVTGIVYTIITNMLKLFWIKNNKELLELEKPLSILDNKDIIKTREVLMTIKMRKKYNFDKNISLNLLLIGPAVFSISLSNIIGTLSLDNRNLFIANSIFGMISVLISIYFGLKADKLFKIMDKKIKRFIKNGNEVIL